MPPPEVAAGRHQGQWAGWVPTGVIAPGGKGLAPAVAERLEAHHGWAHPCTLFWGTSGWETWAAVLPTTLPA